MTPSPEKRGRTRPKPELLAPAGSIETFFAAMEQGADAVYVGTPKFNARLRAPNFTMDELARMVAYARGEGRKVYITLNTIVKETELPELVEILDELRRLRPDALIIQDLGVCGLARRVAPEIPLHASTQMTIHNLDGALQAQRMGFERVILAREMTLEEIASVRRGCEIELETFVHGAMCYAISGECNFSSYAHGKSANRGRCLQPCRRIYDVGEQRLPLFAPLDLNAAPILAQLISAGIRCFKIEGRLKPAESIAQTVAAYRLLIDAHPNITKAVVAEARNRLRLAIGRKQSTGFYLAARPTDAMVGEGMSRSGRFLGKVLRSHGTSFDLQTHETVKVGDRLTVQKSRREPPRGFNVKQLMLGDRPIGRSRPSQTVTIVAPFDVEEGAAVVKSIDADAATEESKRHGDKKWPRATARAKASFGALLRMDDRGAVVLEATVGGDPVAAEEWPSFDGQVEQKEAVAILNREAEQFPVKLAAGSCEGFTEGVPMTGQELEALRDAALAAVCTALDRGHDTVLAELARPLRARGKAKPLTQGGRLVRVTNLEEAQRLVAKHDVGAIVPLAETARKEFAPFRGDPSLRDRLVFELPTFAFQDDAARAGILSALQQALQAGVRQFMVSNLAHFNLLHPHRKRKLTVIAGDPLHCMNSACFETLRECGATHAVFAQEGDRHTLEALVQRVGGARVVLNVFGKVPLFRSRQPRPRGVNEATSVVGAREGLEILARGGLTYVVPERDFSLRHLLPELRALGVAHFLYDLTYTRSPVKRAGKILAPVHAADPQSETVMNFERRLV